MLEIAREKSFHQLICHDLESYPYPEYLHSMENGFHVMMCVGVMDFIRNPRDFLIYIRRFLHERECSRGIRSI